MGVCSGICTGKTSSRLCIREKLMQEQKTRAESVSEMAQSRTAWQVINACDLHNRDLHILW
jgi:hypothetical protein